MNEDDRKRLETIEAVTRKTARQVDLIHFLLIMTGCGLFLTGIVKTIVDLFK